MDQWLATPPSPQDLSSPAKAQARLAGIERQIKSAPERRAELEAYAIPLRRAAGAASSSNDAGGANSPKARIYWIVASASTGPVIIHALGVKAQGAVVVVEDAQGTRSMWDRQRILGALPWLSDADIRTLSAAQIQQVIRQFQVRALAVPQLRAQLFAEAGRLRVATANEAKRKAAVQRDLDAWLAGPLQLSASTKAGDLAQHLLAGERLRGEMPAASARIDEASAPLWAALRQFWAGSVFDGTSWLEGDQARAYQNAAKLKAAREDLIANFRLQAEAAALPAGKLGAVLQWTFGAYIVAGVLGIILLLGRQPVLRVAGLLLFIAAIACALFLYWPLLGPPPGMVKEDAEGSSVPVLEVLANANEVKMGAPLRTADKRLVALTEADANAFLRDRVAFSTSPAASGLVRKSFSIHFSGDRIAVDEGTEWRGRPFVIRYEFPAQKQENEIQFGDPKISINGVALSAQAAKPFSDSLDTLIWSSADQTNVNRAYRVSGIEPGKIALAARAAAPAPIPTPVPTPVTTPTPVPTPKPTPSPDAELYELLGLDPSGNPKKSP